jgi:hypothetical protein
MPTIVRRRIYRSGPRAFLATNKGVLSYDVPDNASLAVWDAILISNTIIRIEYQSI